MAAVFDCMLTELLFVARDKTYWASFESAPEAFYLAGMINSEYAAGEIRAWMTRGLFGERDIHKRILDVPWPVYDPDNGTHARVAELAEALTEQATEIVSRGISVSSRRTRTWVQDRPS